MNNTADYKKLVRPREGRVLAGVCAGFGTYLNLDPVLVRLALIVLVFCAGVGAVLYLAGWVLMPEAADSTTASPVTY